MPDRHWAAIAGAGFDAVWLMGVWERSPAGAAIAVANPDLVRTFRAALPEWAPDDVVGSPYCVRRYAVDRHLGGRAGLAVARAALADRGLGLILDFVPNHVAPDHPWTSAHPEYFVHGSAADLRHDPGSFIQIGRAILARGKDPYSPAWPDVLQLNAFSPGLREAVVDDLLDIAGQCDGVRCDMAMLMINAVFAWTWGERVGEAPTDEYWPVAISAVRRAHPDFSFIAEAYWDLEYTLQQQGFDFCYDKRLYDRLLDGDALAFREHLSADADFQNRLLRFVENHDEVRAAAAFGVAKEKAVALATLTQTGARLVHHGQLEGRKVHLPVFLGRSPHEDIDLELAEFHRSLLMVLSDSTFRIGDWSLCGTSGRTGTDSLVAWCWDGDRSWLVVVNLGASVASGEVRVPWGDIAGQTYRLADPITGASMIRSGDELRNGLPVDLGPWEWHLFEVEVR
ncbi:hypothetical protein BH09ACT7_BH09ACT7_47460 [soil metagenome]